MQTARSDPDLSHPIVPTTHRRTIPSWGRTIVTVECPACEGVFVDIPENIPPACPTCTCRARLRGGE
jgi:hypothetical protein